MRKTVTFPDVVLASEAQRKCKPDEMIVLLVRESLARRLGGAQRVGRFRTAMRRIYGGLGEDTIRALDARAVESRR